MLQHIPSKPTTVLHAASASSAITHKPRIVGHRGALYQELENTIPAFLACAGDCDAIELDVFVLPKDNTLVVFHGSGTDQNPGLLEDYCIYAPHGAKSILDLTYEETQLLQFNTKFAELAAPPERILEAKVPTLENVLQAIKPTGMEVKIELKGLGTAQPTVELVDRLGMRDQVSYSSFNHKEIEMVRKLRPQMNPDGTYVYRTGALFDDVPDDFIQRALTVGASEIHLKYDECTTERIAAIHGAGMSSMAWFRGPIGMKSDTTSKYWDIGNEDESCYQTLMETGVQQLCVNKPDVLAGLLRRLEMEEQHQQQQQQAIGPTPFAQSILPSELGQLALEQPPAGMGQGVSA